MLYAFKPERMVHSVIKTQIVRFYAKWVHIVVQYRCYTIICIFYATEQVAIQEKGRRARKNSVFQTTSMCDLAKMRQNDAHEKGLFSTTPRPKQIRGLRARGEGAREKNAIFSLLSMCFYPKFSPVSQSVAK